MKRFLHRQTLQIYFKTFKMLPAALFIRSIAILHMLARSYLVHLNETLKYSAAVSLLSLLRSI